MFENDGVKSEFLKLCKCALCGEPLPISRVVDGVVKCGVCNSEYAYTVPKEDSKAMFYLYQGSLDLDKCKFSEAYVDFTKAIEADDTEPEAYWGRALATERVQYLKDLVNNRLQPICHEVSSRKFTDNNDYFKAYFYATPAQQAEYKKKAQEIDYIRNEFLNLKNSGLKYDVFICVKVTDDNKLTMDYRDAMALYNSLKNKGFTPFFSEMDLVGKAGADYEAHILYALYSADSMLVVCGNINYLQTKWVKNEYTRFLKMIDDEGKDKDSITIAYRGQPIEHLDGRNGKIQGIDLGNLTAVNVVTDFVKRHSKKYIEAEKTRVEEEAKRKADEEQTRRAEMEALRKQNEELLKRFNEQQKLWEENNAAKRNEFVEQKHVNENSDELFNKAKDFYSQKKYDEAIELFKKAADLENAEAQYYLGYCYGKGQGVKQDYAESAKWYRKAAEQGYATAQNNLASYYRFGRGVGQDCAEAVKWYRKAAEQGQADALYCLGLCYYNGQGIKQDYVEAIKWFKKAAEKGSLRAQNNLGVCYEKGQGVAQDSVEAVKWYRKAAEQGFAVAQCNLGYCYKKGQGVKQDYVEAVKWYRKAAEQGDAVTQCNLGVCYEKGQGVDQDYAEAVKWYRKAAEQGNENAKKALKNLGK